MAEGPGNAPGSVVRILFSRQVQPAYICLPSDEKLMVEGLWLMDGAPGIEG
jgi:hypothetical protein